MECVRTKQSCSNTKIVFESKVSLLLLLASDKSRFDTAIEIIEITGHAPFIPFKA